MKTEKEIRKKIKEAHILAEKTSKKRLGPNYAEGVEDALRWVLNDK